MQFRLTVDTDNAAFDDPDELARILRDVAQRVAEGEPDGGVYDINGNRVGGFETVGA